MVIFRRLLGEVLRSQRMRQGLTLRQVSAEARVSLGYISEVERGQKEASSELLAAICAALDVPLSGILSGCVSAYKTGSSILGTPNCASTLPSTNSTNECTMLCGWTTTSMRSYGIPNRK